MTNEQHEYWWPCFEDLFQSQHDSWERISKSSPITQWLVRDLVPAQAVTLVTGPAGSGKSWLGYALAGALAHGTTFLGNEVDIAEIPAGVDYFDDHNPIGMVRRTVEQLGISRTNRLGVHGIWQPPFFVHPQHAFWIEVAGPYSPSLLVIDSVRQLWSRGDEPTAADTERITKLLRDLTTAGNTVLIMASSRSRDLTALEAAADVVYQIESERQNGALHRLKLTGTKSRFGPVKEFSMELNSGEGFKIVAASPQEDT